MEVVDIDYVYGLKCESRCLFSCRYLDNISEFLFSRVFCDGWVIIASFSWRQRRNFLMSCRWVRVLGFPRWWYGRPWCPLDARCVWILTYWLSNFCWRRKVCGHISFVLGLLRCIYVLLDWVFTVALYTTFLCWQLPCRGHNSLSLQSHCLFECVVLWSDFNYFVVAFYNLGYISCTIVAIFYIVSTENLSERAVIGEVFSYEILEMPTDLMFCYMVGWTKLCFYLCVLLCFLEVYILVFVYNHYFLCIVIYMSFF